jgi:hypothetical protein
VDQNKGLRSARPPPRKKKKKKKKTWLEHTS